jgi:heterodisulfide reductase subunit A
MLKIGIFLDKSGGDISEVIDFERLKEKILAENNDVIFVETHEQLASEEGIKFFSDLVEEKEPDRVVVGTGSPYIYEPIFRRAMENLGLNPFYVEIANLREQIAWVYRDDPDTAFIKALEELNTAIAKVKESHALEPREVLIDKRLLVVGGGVGGLTAALYAAKSGYYVILIEKEKELGGMVRKLNKLYPTLEHAQSLLTPLVMEVRQSRDIRVITGATLERVQGFLGNFDVTIKTEDSTFDERVGAIVIATGAQVLDPTPFKEYNYGHSKDILTGIEYESLLNYESPTKGQLKRLSDGKDVNTIVFIQNVGANRLDGVKYNSELVTMYTAKRAIMAKEKNPEAEVYVFFDSLNVSQKYYNEFLRKAIEKYKVKYIKGGVSEVRPSGDKLSVKGEDQIARVPVEIQADMVVLATDLVPNPDNERISKMAGLYLDEHGFFKEAHPQFGSTESNIEGIFIVGTAQGPKDINLTIAQAQAAVGKISVFFSHVKLKRKPEIPVVDRKWCEGCLLCGQVCPYSAIELEEVEVDGVEKRVASIISEKCVGCGICVPACPSSALDFKGYSNRQLISQILAEKSEKGDVDILAFLVDPNPYKAADQMGVNNFKIPKEIRIIRLPSLGRLDPYSLLRALYAYYNGIIVVSNVRTEATFMGDYEIGFKRMRYAKKFFEYMGMEDWAFVLDEVSHVEVRKLAGIFENTVRNARG